jgi:hypothetical protein
MALVSKPHHTYRGTAVQDFPCLINKVLQSDLNKTKQQTDTHAGEIILSWPRKSAELVFGSNSIVPRILPLPGSSQLRQTPSRVLGRERAVRGTRGD